MKGLWKYLSPFSPDQSGASAVLYGLGGIVLVCDAGGCAGNICGFDEPRWFKQKSAVFSAGLRDMDAILGRDDRLVDKLALAVADVEADFAAIIGTPVPAVIATDYHGLRRLAEKRIHKPVIVIESTGMGYYDDGEEKAYKELFKTFTQDEYICRKGVIGILGLTPLDSIHPADIEAVKECLQRNGYMDVRVYGEGGIEPIRAAGEAEKNLVLSPAGLKAAKYLQKKFGTPYEATYPVGHNEESVCDNWQDKRVLIVHQQVAANALRERLERHGATVCTATWFKAPEELCRDGDVQLKEEDDFIDMVESGGYDIIFADALFRRAVRNFSGTYVDFPHFAVSGRMDG